MPPRTHSQPASMISAASTSPEHVMEVLRKFRIVVGAVRRHTRTLEKASGIAGSQVWMLATIAENPDIGVSALGRMLAIHVSTASNLLEKLARSGLVQRSRSDDDRRTVRLRITPAGEAVLARTPGPLRGILLDALGRLSPETLERLDADLEQLIAQLSEVDATAANEPL